MSEQSNTLKGTFAAMGQGLNKAKAAIQSPENQEKVRKGATVVLAGVVGLLNAAAYTATSAIFAVKNGVVDGAADTDGSRRAG